MTWSASALGNLAAGYNVPFDMYATRGERITSRYEQAASGSKVVGGING
jgi:hypothetical protein